MDSETSFLRRSLWPCVLLQDYDTGAANLAKNYNQGYIAGRMTAYINWATIWSVYGMLPYRGSGLMLANEPWSGHYAVAQALWVTAQTTQFAQPGWQCLNGACGYFGGSATNGSYVSLKAPHGRDYSLTTTSGQAKGKAELLPSAPLPLPYQEDFEQDDLGAQGNSGVTPRLFSDQLVGYQVSQWQNARFQNLRVTAVPTDVIPRRQMTATATSSQPGYVPVLAIDGDPSTFWHTQFAPDKAALPQSITLNLGKVRTVSALGYLPRQASCGRGSRTRRTRCGSVGPN